MLSSLIGATQHCTVMLAIIRRKEIIQHVTYEPRAALGKPRLEVFALTSKNTLPHWSKVMKGW